VRSRAVVPAVNRIRFLLRQPASTSPGRKPTPTQVSRPFLVRAFVIYLTREEVGCSPGTGKMKIAGGLKDRCASPSIAQDRRAQKADGSPFHFTISLAQRLPPYLDRPRAHGAQSYSERGDVDAAHSRMDGGASGRSYKCAGHQSLPHILSHHRTDDRGRSGCVQY